MIAIGERIAAEPALSWPGPDDGRASYPDPEIPRDHRRP